MTARDRRRGAVLTAITAGGVALGLLVGAGCSEGASSDGAPWHPQQVVSEIGLWRVCGDGYSIWATPEHIVVTADEKSCPGGKK